MTPKSRWSISGTKCTRPSGSTKLGARRDGNETSLPPGCAALPLFPRTHVFCFPPVPRICERRVVSRMRGSGQWNGTECVSGEPMPDHGSNFHLSTIVRTISDVSWVRPQGTSLVCTCKLQGRESNCPQPLADIHTDLRIYVHDERSTRRKQDVCSRWFVSSRSYLANIHLQTDSRRLATLQYQRTLYPPRPCSII